MNFIMISTSCSPLKGFSSGVKEIGTRAKAPKQLF